MTFDMTSMHTGFERAATLYPQHRSALLKARANLSGLVATTDTKVLTGYDSVTAIRPNQEFVGSLRDLKDVRVVSTGGSTEAFEARLGGVVGITPEDSFQLAEAILIELDESGHAFDPDMWRMFTMDTLREMVGDRYALEVSMALRVPSAHSFLLESLQTRKPAADDTREKCILKLQTVSIENVSWNLLEVATVAFLIGDADAGQLWTFKRNARQLENARRQARERNDHYSDALGQLSRLQQAVPSLQRVQRQLGQHANDLLTGYLQRQPPQQAVRGLTDLSFTAPPPKPPTAQEMFDTLTRGGYTPEQVYELLKQKGLL